MATINISEIVANQIGKIQGAISAQIQEQVQVIGQEFSNKCPDLTRFAGFANARNTILSHLDSFERKITKFEKYASRLDPIIRNFRRLIRLYKKLPTRVTIGIPPPNGGVLASVSLGVTNTQSDLLRKADKTLEALEKDKEAILALIATITPSITEAKNTLLALDVKILGCVEDYENSELSEEDKALLRDISIKLQPKENLGSEGIPNENYTYRGANGIDYTLEILTLTDDSTLKQRQAVAKNNKGVIVLRGQASYSSDTGVLLDEIKFRIDNQLP